VNRHSLRAGTAISCAHIAILLSVVASACSGPAASDRAVESADTTAQPAQQNPPSSETSRQPFLPDEMQRSTRAESFPHEAHGPIDCTVCHDQPRGHTTHQDVPCSACHEASSDVEVMALQPADCQSCHHGADQPLACETCHEGRPAVTSVQRMNLVVGSAPFRRTLAFDHARHADLSCERCHQSRPTLLPAAPCASCHAEHHTPSAHCASCHETPPPGAHDVQVHLTCSGAACHRAPLVEAMAESRNVCLACHREQENHEPGGECVDCHQVRRDAVTRAHFTDIPGRAHVAARRDR
jgi:hypothetical protein